MVTISFHLPPFDIDNDGEAEQLTFEYADNITISHVIRTGYLTGDNGQGSTIVDILTDLIEEATDAEINVSRDGRRQSLYTDLGGGSRVIETSGDVVTGDTGLQWGTGNGGKYDATGGTALAKIQLLDEALTLAEIDSRPPDNNYPDGHLATLEVGELSESGQWDPLEVVPEQPQHTYDVQRESSTATISINYVTAASMDIAWDAVNRTG